MAYEPTEQEVAKAWSKAESYGTIVTLYHGTSGSGAADWQPHAGACLTDDIRAAYGYATAGSHKDESVIVEIEVVLRRCNTTEFAWGELPVDVIDLDVGDDTDSVRQMLGLDDDCDIVIHADSILTGHADITCYRLLTDLPADTIRVAGYYSAAELHDEIF